MAILTLYGSAVADATLTTACDLSTATGGVETSKLSSFGGSSLWGELWSQGGSPTTSASVGAPTGHGWVYKPGAGTFAAANWSASIAHSDTLGFAINFTIRFSKYTGIYTSIGSINVSGTSQNTRTVFTFAATAMPTMTFGASDLLYVDLWEEDATGLSGENGTIYESTTATNGLANDIQINTANFTPAVTIYVPHKTSYTGRGIDSTLVTQSALWYVGRGLSSTLVTHYITRGLNSTLITPITRTALSGSLAGVGTLAETFSLATALTDTLVGVGTLSETLSLATALSATIPGVGTLTGALTESTALTTTIPGVGTLSATFSLATSLTATIPGVGTLTGTLTESTALASTIPGVGTLNGTFSLATALTVTIPGVGQLLPTLSTTGGVSLAVTMAGVGTLSGTTTLTTALAVTDAGVGTLTGTLSTGGALSATIPGVGTLKGSGTLSVPAYIYPTLAGWTQYVNGAPTVSRMIANVSSGPGGSVNSDYTTGIANAKAAGIQVLGYVHTHYADGSIPLATVEADIDSWYSFYPNIDGIFIDEVMGDAPSLAYYTSLFTYIKAVHPGHNYVELNPGTLPTEAYTSIADTICLFENSYTGWLSSWPTISSSSWVKTYTPALWWAIVYSIPDTSSMTTVVNSMKSAGVGYIFVTDQSGYTSPPSSSFWTNTLALTGPSTVSLSLSTSLSVTMAGAGTLAGALTEKTALSSSMAGAGTLSGVFTIRIALSLTFAGMGTLAGAITIPSLSFLSAICVTRDMQAIAKTRDLLATCVTGDKHAAAGQRDMMASAQARDEQATAKTRSL
jgi:hypothetical protein